MGRCVTEIPVPLHFLQRVTEPAFLPPVLGGGGGEGRGEGRGGEGRGGGGEGDDYSVSVEVLTHCMVYTVLFFYTRQI